MKWGVLALALAGSAISASAACARPPVVVELFTAQGCSSCDKADAYVARLADDNGVIALTYSVDYWDYLGWKDTFAKPEFADRQRAYAHRLGVAEVYTPQVIVDGRAQTAAVQGGDVDRLIRAARRERVDPPEMRRRPDSRLAVGSGPRPKGGAEVWLVRFDPRQQEVEVKDGDNRGKTVTERNVVVEIVRLGAWSGKPVLLKIPPASQEGLEEVFLLQGREGGRILADLRGQTP
ncbi:MAG: DUF1223 domain-containing protein [Caulobacteraceae bacterium]|nr:DUF1223 domain-containing protein [Caulobacteraceae bacterium]